MNYDIEKFIYKEVAFPPASKEEMISDMSLEQFRERMITIHERIKDRYIYKVAITYGIIVINPFDGKFYFERSET